MKRWLFNFVIVCFIMALAACGTDKDEQEAKPQGNTIEITESEQFADDEVVVTVNGTEVLGNKYNIIYPQIKMYVTQMEDEVNLDEINDRTIDALIDQELIYQGAAQEGIIISEEDVEEKFNELKSENEDGLNSLLEQFHLTEQGFKDQLLFELTMEQYVDAVIEVDVTDEEVESHYQNIKEQDDKIPELKDIRGQLKAQMIQGKTEEELEKIVEKMKEKAEIDIKI